MSTSQTKIFRFISFHLPPPHPHPSPSIPIYPHLSPSIPIICIMQPEYPASSFHHPPPPLFNPSKRRRTRTTLISLPIPTLHNIIRHLLRPHAPTSMLIHSELRSLRTSSLYLRRACDTFITTFDFSYIPAQHIAYFISRLWRFENLRQLNVSPSSLAVDLMQTWRDVLPRLEVRSLTMISDAPHITNLFANNLPYLETVCTASTTLLQSLVKFSSNLHSLDLLMDDISPNFLPRFRITSLRLLYRDRINPKSLGHLSSCLETIPTLRVVSLRINKLSSDSFPLLAPIPHMYALSLFDATVISPNRNIESLVNALKGPKVDLCLEWIRGITDQDIQIIVRGLGERLKRLRIWNCELLTDTALSYVVDNCKSCEVELRFVREQFGASALASMGDRVSWESCM